MPSLEARVARQRETVIARGSAIGTRAGRTHGRLRHPAVLIPAFLGGMLIARGATELPALPRLTAALGRLTDELGKLDNMIKLIATLAPILLRPSGAEAGDTSDARSSQTPEDREHHPPPT